MARKIETDGMEAGEKHTHTNISIQPAKKAEVEWGFFREKEGRMPDREKTGGRARQICAALP